uniref:PB1 domain-containing protein n=1 Tax=Tanacetum cinerariifolium TaxID=118510 RepID=A0A6L2LXV7_TANCI|nr:hypothetical protein [Tanacetum cinerariifolium]
MSEKGMKMLVSKGRIPNLKTVTAEFCEPCVLGKQKKVIFKKIGHPPKSEKLERKHINIMTISETANEQEEEKYKKYKVSLTDGRFFSSFKLLKQALKSVGLSTFGVLYKTTSGLGHATHEIEQALEIVCEAHDLAVAQVWIPYENENRVTSWAGSVTKQMLAVKLTGSCVDSSDDILSPIKNYYHICEMLPLELGDGLVGSALQTNEPHFCKNIYELPMTDNKKKPLQKMSSLTKCSCFVICLRSIDNGDLDYAFEFLWPRSRNHFILLESLLLTLKSCLPNFKLASGEQLGNKISPILKALEAEDCISSSGLKCNTPPKQLPRECTRQQYGRPTNENAENLTGWQLTNFVKRKLSDVCESESDSNDDSPNQDILIINAEYADDVFRIHLPISLATLAVVKEEINKRCKLNPGTCKVKYLDEDEDWILMTSDAHLRRCISCWRSLDASSLLEASSMHSPAKKVLSLRALGAPALLLFSLWLMSVFMVLSAQIL